MTMFEARDVEDYLLAFEEDRLLNIVACSNAKVLCSPSRRENLSGEWVSGWNV